MMKFATGDWRREIAGGAVFQQRFNVLAKDSMSWHGMCF